MDTTRISEYLDYIGIDFNQSSLIESSINSMSEIISIVSDSANNLAMNGVGLVTILTIIESLPNLEEVDFSSVESIFEFIETLEIVDTNGILLTFLEIGVGFDIENLDMLADGLEQLSTLADGVDLVDGVTTLGLSLLASYAVKKIGSSINDERREELASLTSRNALNLSIIDTLMRTPNFSERNHQLLSILRNPNSRQICGV